MSENIKSNLSFDQLIKLFRSVISVFPDKRTGANTTYTMENIALSAFSVFFTQSPSFLAHQTAMKEAKGVCNAESLFKTEKIPSDNHIRDILDEVEPELVFEVFHHVFNALNTTDIIDSYRSFSNKLLIPLDGTWYHSSHAISCDKCLTIKHKDGTITYYHSAITPVIITPGSDKVISLPPEFITPQDGHNKQDCENAAAKRWILANASRYACLGVTILGDDLYCKHSICSLLVENQFNFILTCKPESHKTLYEWLNGLEEGVDRFSLVKKVWNGKFNEIHSYRYANQLPLRDSDDATFVNWCEITIANESGKLIYKNSFATNFEINDKNVEQIVVDGRARFKVENENNNILKTKGYNLEHNFGHGSKNLSMLLMTLNLLAFLFHTVLEFSDDDYRLLRKKLRVRKKFFDDIRALTTYLYFKSWSGMLIFMLQGLENKHIPDRMQHLK
jgi:hypothetical protein